MIQAYQIELYTTHNSPAYVSAQISNMNQQRYEMFWEENHHKKRLYFRSSYTSDCNIKSSEHMENHQQQLSKSQEQKEHHQHKAFLKQNYTEVE